MEMMAARVYGWPAAPLLPCHRTYTNTNLRLTRLRTVACHHASTSPPISREPISRANSYFLSDSRPIILFDGVCNLCNGGVNFVLDHDPKGSLRLAALQSEAGRALLERSGRSPNDISSIVLVEKDGSYIKSEAVLRISKYLGVPFPMIAAVLNPLPLFLRDSVYDSVAGNRYSIFGRTRACRLSDPRFVERFIEN